MIQESVYMEEEMLAYLIQRIQSAPIRTSPYSHFHTEQIFPALFYSELIDYIPDASYFFRADKYPQRSSMILEQKTIRQLPFPYFLFWQKFIANISNANLVNTLFNKFECPLQERFGKKLSNVKTKIVLLLVRDQPGYTIGPHTDHPQKIITLLFYLPISDNQKHLGTSIYIPKDRSVPYRSDGHHPFEEFDKISTVPFMSNSVFGFARSDCSFHGVEPIHPQEKERLSLCYTIWEA